MIAPIPAIQIPINATINWISEAYETNPNNVRNRPNSTKIIPSGFMQ